MSQTKIETKIEELIEEIEKLFIYMEVARKYPTPVMMFLQCAHAKFGVFVHR